MQVPALDLRPGLLLSHEGRMCTVVWWNILRNDRRQFVQLRIKDIDSGRVQELKLSGDTRFELLDKQERELTYSYQDGIDEVFFTDEGEEIRCNAEGIADVMAWQLDSYIGFFVNGALVTVFPPRFAEVTVASTSPPVKGAGSGLKEATLENGMTVRVGNIVTTGDRIRIDTETLEFKERV